MAIYEEKKIGTGTAILLLLLLFLLSYPLWHLGERELMWSEGRFAVTALETAGFPPVFTAHGQALTDVPPLFLLLTKALTCFGVSVEFALRFFAVLPYFLLTALVFIVCRRNCGSQAAFAASAVMFTTVIVFEKLCEGYPAALTALLLYGGWMLWIEMGVNRSRWSLAWACIGLFGALIFYNGGMTGLIYFLVPLAFQRRPFTIWNKLKRHPGLYVGLLILLLVILFRTVPQMELTHFQPIRQDVDFSGSDYLKDILLFPLDSFLQLMPWSLFLWAPFCAALVAMEENPLFCKFHRILFLVLLLLIWFNPGSSSRDLLYLMPLIATMLGAHYRILIRRYGHRITHLLTFFAWGILSCSLAAGVYLWLQSDWKEKLLNGVGDTVHFLIGGAAVRFVIPAQTVEAWHDAVLEELNALIFEQPDLLLYRSTLETVVAFILCVAALFLLRKKSVVWLPYAMCFTALALLFWSVLHFHDVQEQPKRQFAMALQEIFREKTDDAPVCINIKGLYPEGYYAGLRLTYVETGSVLPSDAETLYMISAPQVPWDTGRNWSKVKELEYRATRICIYKGQLIRSEDDDDEYED